MVARVPSDGFVDWSASLIKESITNYTAKNNTKVWYLRNLRREKMKDLESMPPISDHSNQVHYYYYYYNNGYTK